MDERDHKAMNKELKPSILGVSSLQSLLEDLKGFESMRFLNADVKSGLGMAIEQVERYIRRDLKAQKQQTTKRIK